MQGVIREVKVCVDCPFCIWVNFVGSELCFHPKTEYKTIDEAESSVPDFCPLREAKITVQLNGVVK